MAVFLNHWLFLLPKAVKLISGINAVQRRTKAAMKA
jgi:hypothetical protein